MINFYIFNIISLINFNNNYISKNLSNSIYKKLIFNIQDLSLIYILNNDINNKNQIISNINNDYLNISNYSNNIRKHINNDNIILINLTNILNNMKLIMEYIN